MCDVCKAPPSTAGSMYDTRGSDTVHSLDELIRVGKPGPAPASAFFIVGTHDETANSVNLEVVQYIRLDRVPQPLRDLVRETLDAMKEDK